MAAKMRMGGVEIEIYGGAEAGTIDLLLKALKDAKRFYVRVPGIPGVRIYGSAARDRRAGGYGTAAISSGPVPKSAVSLFVGGGKTGLRACTGKRTGFCYCTSGWRRDGFSVRGTEKKRKRSRYSSTGGSWRDWMSSRRKRTVLSLG